MRPTRREFFGVAAVALGGADLLRQDSRVPARFVGDAFERGHHWLTPDPEKLHVDKKEKKRVVIVGGGVAGVVAAWRLLEAGVDDFVLLELEDKAGGLARQGIMGNTVVPFGATIMKFPDGNTSRAVTNLLEGAGLHVESRPLERVRVAQPTPLSPRAWDGARWAFDWETTRPGEVMVADDRMEVYQRAASRASFEDRWCLFHFGARHRDIGRAAFVRHVERSGFANAPRGSILSVPGGLATLLTPALAKLGERFLKARVAVLVKPEENGGLVRTVNALDATVTDFAAEAVVLAVPPFIARKVAPAIRERDKNLSLPENTPWLVTAFQLSDWPRGFDPAIAIHQTTDERATRIVAAGAPPEAVIVVHRPFPASATTPARMLLRDWSPDDARDWAFREMDPVFPDLRRLTRRVELWRVGHGSIRPGPGYWANVATRIRKPLGAIHPCGADYSMVPCVEAAVDEGVRAAEDVLERFGKLTETWGWR